MDPSEKLSKGGKLSAVDTKRSVEHCVVILATSHSQAEQTIQQSAQPCPMRNEMETHTRPIYIHT